MAILTFDNVAKEWGLGEETWSNGMAYADLDNDGDLDLVVNNLEDQASIYRNDLVGNHYLVVELKGNEKVLPNGSRVFLYTEEGMQVQEHNVVRGYFSSVSPRLHFGLGQQDQVDRLEVHWPNGHKTVLSDVMADQLLTIDYQESQTEVIANQTQESGSKMFETIDFPNAFVHEENPFNDFEVEVLLPHKNSSLGPGLATGDLNGDGLDDFIVGSAFGQLSQAYLQQKNGSFEPLEIPALSNDHYYEDLGIIIFDADGDGDEDFYVASGGNEFKAGSKAYEDRFYENLGNNQFQRVEAAIPASKVSGKELSTVDFDHDGDLDLFVGGRLVPKQYPYPAKSYLLENVSKSGEIKFVNTTTESMPSLDSLGLVTASSWADIDGDGWEDLMVVGEWMTIRCFKNNQGTFAEVSEQVLPENTAGWWYDIQPGDFDKDGDVDFVVGNLGKNYKYQASEEAPFRVYFNDFDRNRKPDIVLSYQKGETEFPVRGRQCSSEQMPAIKVKFEDYNSFASANLKQIYTTKMLEESLSYAVTSFASVYLENNDGQFTLKPLPQLAQLSSINKMVVEDMDQDGNLDVVIAGNLYNAEVETPRNDASFGLFLQGNGAGDFTAQTMLASGLKMVGDIRGMELIQRNGQRHLLIAKNDDVMQMVKVNSGMTND